MAVGIRFASVKTAPWICGGMLRTTGDISNTARTHNTFFSVLPTLACTYAIRTTS